MSSEHSTQNPEREAHRALDARCARENEGASSISPAQLAANCANAQLSTGPKTDAGKGKSSLNAVKTGLTGRTVLLPGDDAEAYQRHVQSFFDKHQPEGDSEHTLVQSLADTEWRLLRIPSLETGIYALGRLEFAELFPNEDEAVRKQLIEAKIFLVYQRQLNNLSIQEGRLRRQRETDTAALRELQEHRKREARIRQSRLNRAAEMYIRYLQEDQEDQFDVRQLGFDFSTSEIKTRALEMKPELFNEQTPKPA
jgi:hypothetical protein